MPNLLTETKEILKENDIELSEILWVGSSQDDFYIPLENALEIMDIEYYDGFGAQSVAKDLIVVGKNWWLERHEYDGSEWWEFKRIPIKPSKSKAIQYVAGGMWNTLADMNI